MREVNEKGRTDSFFRFYPHAAAVFFKNAMHHCEPQPCAAADVFGGEERIENFCEVCLFDSAAVIDYFHADGSFFYGPLDANKALRALGGVNRIARVQDQVGENLFELALIALHQADLIFIDLKFHIVIFKLIAQHGRDIIDNLFQRNLPDR